jgi:hypothetical protein
MSTQRYSGSVRVRVTYLDPRCGTDEERRIMSRYPHGRYRCVVVLGETKRTVWVGPPASLEHAVDCPQAFDEAASAAIKFADYEDEENGVPVGCRVGFSEHCDYHERGDIAIRRFA